MDFKFTASRAQLSSAVAAVARAAGNTPETAGTKLTVTGTKLMVAATDLDMGIRARIEVSDTNDGSVVVPVKLLGSLLKSLDGEVINVEFKDGQVHLTCGRGAYKLPVVADGAFPEMAAVEGSKLNLSADALHLIVDLVAHAASSDITRGTMCGVRIEGDEDGTVHAVATDSYRLAALELGTVDGFAAGAEAVIPARALTEAHRHVDGDVTVTLGENQVSFRSGDVEVRSRLLVGPYPAWRTVVTGGTETGTVVDGAELVSLVHRVGLMDSSAQRVELELADGELTIRGGGREGGTGAETMTVESTEEFTVVLNPIYLSAAIEAAGAGKIGLGVSDSKPVFITAEELDLPWTAMVMPMR